jgi:hypothetical protein
VRESENEKKNIEEKLLLVMKFKLQNNFSDDATNDERENITFAKFQIKSIFN